MDSNKNNTRVNDNNQNKTVGEIKPIDRTMRN